MASDPLLDGLAAIGDGVVTAVGFPVTLLTSGARIEGSIARPTDFAARFDDDMAAAFRVYAADTEDVNQRRAAEGAAEVFEGRPTHATAVSRDERRRELAEELDDLGSDDPRRADLEAEDERLAKRSPMLILKDPRIWTYGYNPLTGPLTPPFVRIAVASVTAWWPGQTSE